MDLSQAPYTAVCNYQFANLNPTYSKLSPLYLNNSHSTIKAPLFCTSSPLPKRKTCSTPPPTTFATHADLLASSLHDILAV